MYLSKSLQDVKNPLELREKRVKSAYQFGAYNTKYSKRKEDVFEEEIQRQKQKFLLANNISDSEYQKLNKDKKASGDKINTNNK